MHLIGSTSAKVKYTLLTSNAASLRRHKPLALKSCQVHLFKKSLAGVTIAGLALAWASRCTELLEIMWLQQPLTAATMCFCSFVNSSKQEKVNLASQRGKVYMHGRLKTVKGRFSLLAWVQTNYVGTIA